MNQNPTQSSSDRACLTMVKFVLLFMVTAPIFGMLADGSAQRANRSEEPNMGGELMGILLVGALAIVPIATVFRSPPSVNTPKGGDT